jgi:hypothetical protein
MRRPFDLLLRPVKAVVLLAAIGVPIYIFVTSESAPARHSAPPPSLARATPQFDDGFRDPARWVYADSSSSEASTSVHGGALVLPAPPRRWLAAYLSPAQTAAWRDYRVRLRVEHLGSAGSGANATLLLGSGRLAVTVSAGRVRVSNRSGARLREFALGGIRPGSSHDVEATVLGRKLNVTIDGVRAPARALTLPGHAVRGGIGLGVWRERVSSPRPRFTSLSVSPAASVDLR